MVDHDPNVPRPVLPGRSIQVTRAKQTHCWVYQVRAGVSARLGDIDSGLRHNIYFSRDSFRSV